MKKCFEVKISGRVQNVGFRQRAVEKASDLKIVGFIRNESDGTVLLNVEGEEEALQKFLGWCRRGPLFARVDRLDFSEVSEHDFADFKIDYV